MKNAIASFGFLSTLLAVPMAIALQSKPSESQQVEKFKQTFPLIQQQRVTSFKDLDWCKTFEYQKGKFTNNKADRCTYDFDQKQKFGDFSNQAQSDFDQVTRLLSAPKVETLEVKFQRSGAIESARLRVFAGDVEPACKVIWSCNVKTYVYRPGYDRLPEDIGREIWHERINQDWYIEWQDWN